MQHWEERLTDSQHAKVEVAIVAFRNTRKKRRDQLVLYDALTCAGMSPEEADEMCNLEMEE